MNNFVLHVNIQLVALKKNLGILSKNSYPLSYNTSDKQEAKCIFKIITMSKSTSVNNTSIHTQCTRIYFLN